MFSYPRPNLIESNEGFSVEVLGRTGMRYREGDKAVLIDSEVLAPGKGIAIVAASIQNWVCPDGSEPINSDQRTRIVTNIRAAIESKGQPLELV
jgi:hypothetical protein